jgi:hypothetical protein
VVALDIVGKEEEADAAIGLVTDVCDLAFIVCFSQQ